MGERSEDYYRATYEPDQVITLLGLREGWRAQDARHLTVADLLSWAQDPGGDRTAYQAALQREPKSYWMARRGPIEPDSETGATLWDLRRAMSTLPRSSRAMLALNAWGFTYRDIAELLGTTKDDVARTIWGTPRRESAVEQVTRAMNTGPGPAAGPRPDEARIALLREHIRGELRELRSLLQSDGEAPPHEPNGAGA